MVAQKYTLYYGVVRESNPGHLGFISASVSPLPIGDILKSFRCTAQKHYSLLRYGRWVGEELGGVQTGQLTWNSQHVNAPSSYSSWQYGVNNRQNNNKTNRQTLRGYPAMPIRWTAFRNPYYKVTANIIVVTHQLCMHGTMFALLPQGVSTEMFSSRNVYFRIFLFADYICFSEEHQ